MFIRAAGLSLPPPNVARPKLMQATLLRFTLPTGSEERGALGVGSIPGAMLPSC